MGEELPPGGVGDVVAQLVRRGRDVLVELTPRALEVRRHRHDGSSSASAEENRRVMAGLRYLRRS